MKIKHEDTLCKDSVQSLIQTLTTRGSVLPVKAFIHRTHKTHVNILHVTNMDQTHLLILS